jgi:hypothetical protein
VDPTTAGALARHGQAVATVRAFARAAGATRVVVLVDRGPAEPALMVDVDHAGDVEITDDDVLVVIPRSARPPAQPLPLPDVRATPPTAISIDADTGELSAPIGTIDHLAAAVTALAATFGGRTVATAELPTQTLPITIAAREGEPPILSAAGEQFELPQPRRDR